MARSILSGSYRHLGDLNGSGGENSRDSCPGKLMALIAVTNLQKRRIDRKWLKRIAGSVLELEPGGKEKEIDIVLVDSERMKELNEKYRGRTAVTDVLAFPLGDDLTPTKNLLGEVVVCVEKADEQARERKHSMKEELALLLVHGILHLLDYRDEKTRGRKIMQEREREILESLGMRGNIV